MKTEPPSFITLKRQLRSTTDSWERLPILLSLARLHNDRDIAYQAAVEALQTAKSLNDQFWIACSLRAIGIQMNRDARYTDMISYLEKASEIFLKINNRQMKAQTDLPLARIYTHLGMFDKATELLTQIIPVVKGLGDTTGSVRALRYSGDIYKAIGEHGKGLECYRQALAVALKADLEWEAAYLYQDLAFVYQNIGDDARRQRYLFKGMAAHKRLGNREGLANVTANIASMFLERESYKQAEKFVRQSKKLYHELGITVNEGVAFGKLGFCYAQRGEFKQAFHSFEKGLLLVRRGENKVMYATFLSHFGAACILAGKPEQGLIYLKEVLTVINESGYLQYQSDAHLSLSQVYEKLGDPAKALEHYKEHTRLNTKYFKSQKLMEASHVDMKMHIRLLSKQLRKEQIRNNQLRRTIEEKEAALVTMTLSLIREEQMEGKRKVSRPIKTGSNWEIFARQFHKVHYDFYGKILQRYPQLTPTEVKVCSLIRIGLSSKDIADILCISYRTVETHRNHIRKQMSLPRNISLTSFITRL